MVQGQLVQGDEELSSLIQGRERGEGWWKRGLHDIGKGVEAGQAQAGQTPTQTSRGREAEEGGQRSCGSRRGHNRLVDKPATTDGPCSQYKAATGGCQGPAPNHMHITKRGSCKAIVASCRGASRAACAEDHPAGVALALAAKAV